MPFFVHSNLRNHPKVKRMARQLKLSLPETVGYLTLFWGFVAEFAPQGDISRFNAEDIASGIEWPGEPEVFINAMLDCGPGGSPGFLEKTSGGEMLVHDWEEHQNVKGGGFQTGERQGLKDSRGSSRGQNA